MRLRNELRTESELPWAPRDDDYRKTVCFAWGYAFPNVPDFSASVFAKHGQHIAFGSGDDSYSNADDLMKLACDDGDWMSASLQPLTKLTKEVSRSSDNGGITETFACPDGKRIVGLRASCNL